MPAPPDFGKSSLLQLTVKCDEFHDSAQGSVIGVFWRRSWWPTMAKTSLLGPLAAGHVGLTREARVGRAIGPRSGQDVVHVRRVATPVDRGARLGQCGQLGHVVAAVQLGPIVSDQHALGVEPRPLADAVAGVDGSRARRDVAGAEVGAPGAAARTDRGRQLLAMRVGARQAAEVAAIAGTGAGDEEAHRARLRCRHTGRHQGSGGRSRNGDGEDAGGSLHGQYSWLGYPGYAPSARCLPQDFPGRERFAAARRCGAAPVSRGGKPVC